jgi:uncharacterized protein YndB with AHSA1/START domain
MTSLTLGLSRAPLASKAIRRHPKTMLCRTDSANQKEKERITMATNTVRLHRVLRAPPERVYRAFINAEAMAKWIPPNGFTGTVHHMDARVGGTFRMTFTNFTTGQSHSFGGEYLELVPNELIRYTDEFEDPNLPGVIQVTVSLKAVSYGTELNVVQEGIPDVIPVEMCYLGWQESLELLAKLVEPEIRE